MSPKTKKAKDDRGAGRGDRASQAYWKLRELIVWGKLAPGARIIESEVASRLGISRTPVRSALHRLEQEGYVNGQGTGRQSRLAVAPLTREDAEELFGIVGEVEGLAARWAAQQDEAERTEVADELARINGDLDACASGKPPDHRRIFELDDQFHRCCVEHGAGPRLLSLHDAIKPQAERYIRLYINALVAELGTSVVEHGIIIDGIEQGRPDAAQRAVQTNWRNAADRLSRVIEAMGERGSW